MTETTSEKRLKSVTVRVGKLPGRIEEITLDAETATVMGALKTANIDHHGYEIRMDNQRVTPETPVKEGATVLVVKEMAGA